VSIRTLGGAIASLHVVFAALLLLAACGGGGGLRGTGGSAGTQVGGAAGTAAGGAGGMTGPPDAATGDGGFATDFASRAAPELAAHAPPWTCATTLPTVAVADATAARDVIRQFVAQIAGFAPGDVGPESQTCGASTSTSCATFFAHDVAKNGGSLYDTVVPFAQELEANATNVESTLWIPTGSGGAIAIVMSGIADGMLVGMVQFEAPYACN